MKCLIGIAGMMWMLLLNSAITYAQDDKGDFKKTTFYKAMADGTESDINNQLAILKVSSFVGKQAFEGSLLMKKAGLIAGAKKKLNLFKEGHQKLEAELNKDSLNAEYRFLRLMIQEHAPGILGYKQEIDRDGRYVEQNFNKLSAVVQQAITSYSKKSKVLKPVNFN